MQCSSTYYYSLPCLRHTEMWLVPLKNWSIYFISFSLLNLSCTTWGYGCGIGKRGSRMMTFPPEVLAEDQLLEQRALQIVLTQCTCAVQELPHCSASFLSSLPWASCILATDFQTLTCFCSSIAPVWSCAVGAILWLSPQWCPPQPSCALLSSLILLY